MKHLLAVFSAVILVAGLARCSGNSSKSSWVRSQKYKLHAKEDVMLQSPSFLEDSLVRKAAPCP